MSFFVGLILGFVFGSFLMICLKNDEIEEKSREQRQRGFELGFNQAYSERMEIDIENEHIIKQMSEKINELRKENETLKLNLKN